MVKYSNRIINAHGWEGITKYRIAQNAKEIWVESQFVSEDRSYSACEQWGLFDSIDDAKLAIQLSIAAENNDKANDALIAFVANNAKFKK
jgi:hypothetical protein